MKYKTYRALDKTDMTDSWFTFDENGRWSVVSVSFYQDIDDVRAHVENNGGCLWDDAHHKDEPRHLDMIDPVLVMEWEE